MSLRVRLIISAAAAFSIGLLWLTEIPLGIPGEWTWNRIDHPDAVLVLLGVLQTSAVFVLFAFVAWAGARRVAVATRRELTGWLLGLMIAGFTWLHAVQETPPAGLNAAKIPFVLYYPSSSGYFHKARYEVEDTAEFLRGYEDTVREGDVLHEGTHPPGLVVFFRGLIRFAEAAPGLAALPQVLLPDSAEEAFDFIRDRNAGTPHALTETGRSVICLAAMLTQLAAVALVVPLFALIRLTCDRETAWRTVCFWPLVPAVAIFLPKSDVLFSFVSCLLVCTWLYAVRAASRGEVRFAPLAQGALAGAIGWLGLFCSLAFLPAGAIAVLASALLFRKPTEESAASDKASEAGRTVALRNSARLHALPVLGGLLSFAALTVLVAVVWDLNLPRVWQLNYANHARFYEVSPRSHFGWLLVNPVELFLAIGAPVACVLFVRRPGSAGCRAVVLAVGVVWGLLWLTGKNSGEAARLWIPLMPMALWAGACCWSRAGAAENSEVIEKPATHETREWLTVLALQAAVCLATVFRVSGFLQEQGVLD